MPSLRARDRCYPSDPQEWPGEVRVEFHQHALACTPTQRMRGGRRARGATTGKFWEMHDVLFAHQSALDPESLLSYARNHRARRRALSEGLRRSSAAYACAREGAVADRLGATGTPAFFVNGLKSVGWGSWDGFRSNVARELDVVNGMLARWRQARRRLRSASQGASEGRGFLQRKCSERRTVGPLARAGAASTSKKHR